MAILSNTWNRQDRHETFFGPALRDKLLSKLHLDDEFKANIIPIETRRKSWLLKVCGSSRYSFSYIDDGFFSNEEGKVRKLLKKQRSHRHSMTFLPEETKQF
jgi:hypothetical protein